MNMQETIEAILVNNLKECREKLAKSEAQVTRLRELCGEIWVSIPDHVSYYDWCALKKRYEQRLKDEEIEIE